MILSVKENHNGKIYREWINKNDIQSIIELDSSKSLLPESVKTRVCVKRCDGQLVELDCINSFVELIGPVEEIKEIESFDYKSIYNFLKEYSDMNCDKCKFENECRDSEVDECMTFLLRKAEQLFKIKE